MTSSFLHKCPQEDETVELKKRVERLTESNATLKDRHREELRKAEKEICAFYREKYAPQIRIEDLKEEAKKIKSSYAATTNKIAKLEKELEKE